MRCLYSRKKGKVKSQTKSSEINDFYFKTWGFRPINQPEILINKYYSKDLNFHYFDRDLAGDELYYEQLQKSRDNYYNPHRKEFDIAKKLSSEDKSVLEIGCGSGYFADQLNCKSFLGLEFNQMAIDKATEKGLKVIKSSIENLASSTEEKFDLIFSFHVLEHVKDPLSFVDSAKKLLKEDGLLFLAVPNNDSVLTYGKNVILNIPPHHLNQYTRKTFECFSTYHKLEIIKIEDVFIGNKTPELTYNARVLTNWIFQIFYKSEIVQNEKFTKVENYVIRILSKIWRFYPFKKESQGENLIGIFKNSQV